MWTIELATNTATADSRIGSHREVIPVTAISGFGVRGNYRSGIFFADAWTLPIGERMADVNIQNTPGSSPPPASNGGGGGSGAIVAVVLVVVILLLGWLFFFRSPSASKGTNIKVDIGAPAPAPAPAAPPPAAPPPASP